MLLKNLILYVLLIFFMLSLLIFELDKPIRRIRPIENTYVESMMIHDLIDLKMILYQKYAYPVSIKSSEYIMDVLILDEEIVIDKDCFDRVVGIFQEATIALEDPNETIEKSVIYLYRKDIVVAEYTNPDSYIVLPYTSVNKSGYLDMIYYIDRMITDHHGKIKVHQRASGSVEKLWIDASNLTYKNHDGVTYALSDYTLNAYVLGACEEGKTMSHITLLNDIDSYPVTHVSPYAFYNHAYLKSIDLPIKLSLIRHYAFSQMPLLEAIYIPLSVTYIGLHAFKNTPSLTIYIQTSEKPYSWHDLWNSNNQSIVWDYEPLN